MEQEKWTVYEGKRFDERWLRLGPRRAVRVGGPRDGAVDPAVADLIESAPFASTRGGLARAHATELDRYVRHEFKDRESRWFVDAIHRLLAQMTEGDSDDAPLLRRFVRAIAEIR